MNTERLLEHYDRIADAPDAIPRLRRFILDLAVRGKLVPQDPNDEPASELLKRIKAKNENVDRSDLPTGWVRSKVGTLLDLQYGKGMKVSERSNKGPVPVFGSNGIVGYCSEPLTMRPSIIVGRKGSAGALNLCDEPSWTTDVAYYVEPPIFFVIHFLLIALQGLDLDRLGKGVKPGLSRSDAYEQLICVPPLAEQHRIVAKVGELMALCDRLEAARAEREATRDRLSAASLGCLNTPDPELAAFFDHARFALNKLASLTTRPDQIKQLRQTILNLAVRGKLVPQDAHDEPASELLKRIAAARARLVGGGQIQETDGEPVDEDEAPFDLPPSWIWTRLGELCSKTGSGSTPRGGKSVYRESGVPFLRSQNIYNDGLKLDDVAYIDTATHARMSGTIVRPSDLLLNITGGSIGRCCLVPGDFVEANVSQHVAIIRVAVDGIQDFLHRLILSLYFQEFIFDEQTGAGRGGLPKNRMDHIPVALPPLAEQHRIVAKVDELMALCDRLEASLATGDDARRRLLDALLAEALAPGEGLVPEEPERVAVHG